jgi:hypothetical protein
MDLELLLYFWSAADIISRIGRRTEDGEKVNGNNGSDGPDAGLSSGGQRIWSCTGL